jgi:hypothetical protein
MSNEQRLSAAIKYFKMNADTANDRLNLILQVCAAYDITLVQFYRGLYK